LRHCSITFSSTSRITIYLYLSIYLYLYLYLSIYLYLYISIYIYLSIYLYRYLSISLSIYRFIYLSVSISIYLSIYLCIYISIPWMWAAAAVEPLPTYKRWGTAQSHLARLADGGAPRGRRWPPAHPGAVCMKEDSPQK